MRRSTVILLVGLTACDTERPDFGSRDGGRSSTGADESTRTSSDVEDATPIAPESSVGATGSDASQTEPSPRSDSSDAEEPDDTDTDTTDAGNADESNEESSSDSSDDQSAAEADASLTTDERDASSQQSTISGGDTSDADRQDCQEDEMECIGDAQIRTCNAVTGKWNTAQDCPSDGVECTSDICEADACVNKLEDNYCRIDGSCLPHNQNNPDNSCLYCDAVSNQNDWTPHGTNVQCDDDLWCNGSDTCDGNGSCATHAFPSNNRCAGGEVCNNTCNEADDTCYSPSTTACDTDTEYDCSEGCGSDIMVRTVTRFCTGSSASCNGEIENSDWEVDDSCSSGEVCTGNVCTTDAECSCVASGSYFDTTTRLCWQSTPATSLLSFQSAITYCEDGEWGGFTDWELPYIDELITLLRGCQNGESGPSSDLSTCEMSPANCTEACSSTTECLQCAEGDGPSNGCYWPSELAGFCFHYWANTYSGSVGSFGAWRVSFNWGDASTGSIQDSSYYARCVRR